MLTAMPIAALVAIFVAAAVVVWMAGIKLAETTEVLSERFGLGQALGGAILLAVATNLPEIAIVASAAAANNLELAVGNILGGIAIQTVVLVAIDRFGTTGKPLMTLAATPALAIEGLLVIAVLAMTIMATQLPASQIALRTTPGVLGIAALWIAGLWLIRRAGRARTAKSHSGTTQRTPASTARAALVFTVAAVATLLAGIALERSSDGIASTIGLNGALFGATVLAAATSLPELSTGLRSARDGRFEMAVSDIFGGNAFLPVLFVLAVLISGRAVLPGAQASDLYLTGLAMLLTGVYLGGLILKPQRRVLGMGADSLVVLILYIVGVALLATVPGAAASAREALPAPLPSATSTP